MIFRASFSISMFFLMRALLSRFGWVLPRARAMKLLIWVELPVLVGLLVGSFYIPNCKVFVPYFQTETAGWYLHALTACNITAISVLRRIRAFHASCIRILHPLPDFLHCQPFV
jgi:hypothetical protein